MVKIFLTAVFLLGCLAFPINFSRAVNNDDDCLCIASEAVRKYCAAENGGVVKDEYRINQEAIARRDIQQLINQDIGTDIAKDATARSSIETADFTIKELDGEIFTKESAAQTGASANNYQGVLRITEDTRIRVECLTLRGKDATVYTNQHYVRYVPDLEDESPHEIITNIIHREIWTFTERGWKIKHLEELERGNHLSRRKTLQSRINF